MQQNVVLRLLPEILSASIEDSPFLDAATSAIEHLHIRPEAVLADLDVFFRPRVVPRRYLPALSSWVDLDWVLTSEQRAGREPFGPGTIRLRYLIEGVHELSSWRGTSRGLQAFLETATGLTGFDVAASPDRAFHTVVTVPAAAVAHLALIHRIVAEEKPVCTTHEVVVAPSPTITEGQPHDDE